MVSIGSNTRCCATCAHWDGDRKPNFSFVSHSNKAGRCYRINKIGGIEMMPFGSCSGWQKWAPLQ